MIVKTPLVLDGVARIDGTRIAVSMLVAYHDDGMADATILEYFPMLSEYALKEAWEYASEHSDEMVAELNRKRAT